MIDFSLNHFELFGLPAHYRIDGAALERIYRELQATVHPDRHAGGTDIAQRLALQASARVNEAYRTLRDPVARGEYLLHLRGVDAANETDSRLPLEFLSQQLERREAADAALETHDEPALDRLIAEVRADAASVEGDVERALDAADDEAARMRVREFRFLVKLADDLDALRAVEQER